MACRRGTGRTQGRGPGETPAGTHQAAGSGAPEGGVQQPVHAPGRGDASVCARAVGGREGRGSGRDQRGGVRAGTGGKAHIAPGPAPSGDVPATTEPPSLDPEGGRTTAPPRDTGDRGQDRAARAGGCPDGSVRGGVSQFLVRVSAWARVPRRAARAWASH